MPDRATIAAEASAWIAQMDGIEPSPEDLAALREWMNRSAQHRAEIERLSALWNDLNVLTLLAVPLPGRSEKLFRRRVGHPAAVAAAACIVVLGIAAGVWQWRLGGVVQLVTGSGSDGIAPHTIAYSTVIGQQRTIDLADGSLLTLNTDSHVTIDFDGDKRKVRLLRGEALFEVAQEPGRPFLVYAGRGLVRAVGTAFSVYLKGENSVSVTVAEGKVELSAVPGLDPQSSAAEFESRPPAPLVKIEAGQSATFGQRVESVQSLARVELERQLAWREGMLRFHGEALSHAIGEVGRYTTQKIVILDPALRDLRIGGHFKVGETEAMFEALETSFGVHVERISEDLIYLSSAHRE
jgi:transmembrane sensor